MISPHSARVGDSRGMSSLRFLGLRLLRQHAPLSLAALAAVCQLSVEHLTEPHQLRAGGRVEDLAGGFGVHGQTTYFAPPIIR